MTPKTVGAAWKNGSRGTPWRGPLRQPGPHQPGPRQPRPRQPRLRQLGLALLLVTLATCLASCGIRPTEVIAGLEAPTGPVENTSPSLFFVQSGGALAATSRPSGSLSGTDVVALLAQGPTEAERTRGLTTEVPVDAAPAFVDRVANGLDVTLSTDVSLLSDVAVQQVVCTLLGIQAVGTVNLRGGGHSLEFRKCA